MVTRITRGRLMPNSEARVFAMLRSAAAAQPVVPGLVSMSLSRMVQGRDDPGLTGGPRLASGDLRSDRALQLQRHVLYDMAHPRPRSEARLEPADPAHGTSVLVQPWHCRHEAIGEARDPLGRGRFKRTQVDAQMDHGQARPAVRPMQHTGAQLLDGSERHRKTVCYGARRIRSRPAAFAR